MNKQFKQSLCLILLAALLYGIGAPAQVTPWTIAWTESAAPEAALLENEFEAYSESTPVDTPADVMADFEIGDDDSEAEAFAGDADGAFDPLTVEVPDAVPFGYDEFEGADASEGAPGTVNTTDESAEGGEVSGVEAAGEDEFASNEPETVAVTGLTAPKTTLTLGVKEKIPLNVTALPEGAECTLKYVVSDKKNVSVNADGVVSCKKAGSFTVRAEDGAGHKLKIKLKVKNAPKKVTAKVARNTLGVGEVTTYSHTLPKNTAGRCTALVDAGGVLALDAENGRITALAPGVGTLTIQTYNGKKGSVKITVFPMPDHLVPSTRMMDLGVGLTADFKASLPQGTMSAIRYESLNPEIAAIDAASGKVKGIAAGEACVRGVAFNGAVGECTVHVRPMPQDIELEETSRELLVGERYIPAAHLVPEDAYGKLTLSTKNKKIVKIKGDYAVAVAKGKTTLTVKTSNGLTRSVNVQVLAAPKAIVLKKHTSNLASGETLQLDYSLTGGGKTMVSFESSTPEVATVDEATGEVTGVSAGTAIITAYTLNGLRDSCLVNVDLDMEQSDVNGDFRITFMNIGRNDGILIYSHGEYAFIDSGMHSDGLKAVKYMRNQGVTHLKYYIGTHAHRDHVGGAAPILAAFDVDLVVVPHSGVSNLIKREAETTAEKAAVKAVKYHVIKRNDVICLGDARLTCVGPVKIKSASYRSTAENVNSLILNVRYGSNTFLLTGDATGGEVEQVRKANPDSLRAQVLKNPHHNGRLDAIIKYCKPQITVFSTNNGCQPTSSFITYIRNRGSDVYITSSNRNGHVTIFSDGTNLTVTTQK